jgi:carbon-monoxide dehydrogenase small subunit
VQAVLAEMKEGAPAPQAKEQAAAVAPMPVFAARSEPAVVAASASTAPVAAPEENRRGWSRIEGGFDVAYPQEQVWQFMADPQRLAACLPGAQVQEMDGNTVKGGIVVKFGPISASFNGAATLERDEANRTGMLRGAGTDSVSHSRAKGDIAYRVTALDDTRSRVEVSLEHMLQGPLAQFSRSGLVRDFVTRMMAEFGRNLEASMGGASADQLPVQKIGFMRMLWQVIVGRFS